MRRFVGTLLVLLLLAAGGAAVVIATSRSDNAVKLRRVVYDDVQQATDALKQLVDDNTR
jgi:NADPH:quinone reductase-like Zn-dependent oxidoreductase